MWKREEVKEVLRLSIESKKKQFPCSRNEKVHQKGTICRPVKATRYSSTNT